MKKITLISLIIALMTVVSGCPAESAFAPLEVIPSAAPVQAAPSYGAMANVSEDQVAENAMGGTIVIYRNVDASGYNSFGVYLGGLGFSVDGQEQMDGQIAYSLTDGQTAFVMIYDRANQVMTLIYPKGTVYEKSAFPGYTRVNIGEEIVIPGLGRFVFGRLTMDGSCVVCAFADMYDESDVKYYDENGKSGHRNAKSWITFSYYNTTAGDRTFSRTGNDLFEAVLVYQNADNQYSFEMKEYGSYLESMKIISTAPNRSPSQYSLIENRPCGPLSTLEGAVVFDLPDGLRASSDGTVVIRLDFGTGEKYLLVVRENGAK